MIALTFWLITTASRGAVGLLAWSWQALALLALVWLAMKLLRMKSPALRHQVWLLGLVAVATAQPAAAPLKSFPSLGPSLPVLNYMVEAPQAVVDFTTQPPAQTSPNHPTGAITQEPLHGDWVGGVQLGSNWIFIQAHFKAQGSGITGTLDIPRHNAMGLTLSQIRAESTGIHFELNTSFGASIFDGQLKQDTIEGSAEQSGQLGSFQLIRIAKVDSNKYVGAYQVNADRLIYIRRWVESRDPNRLQYIDSGSGRLSSLFPRSETSFFSGPRPQRPLPIEVEVTFVKDSQGQITELIWRQRGSQEVRARKSQPYREEEVTFRNGEVTLAGTLVTPLSTGPHPAVVITHGSGPQPRASGGLGLGQLVRRGLAVLSYDKRGVGASTGDFRQASLEDLAEDAVAGARFLQTRKEINAKQIGFRGNSQGAWVAPLAAFKFREAAFVIAVSGGGITLERQELLDSEYVLREAGFSDEEVGEALEFQRSKNNFMRTGAGWEIYADLRQRAQSRRWFNYPGIDANGPATKEAPLWASLRLIYFYDPAPILEKLTCPLLAIFGELDTPKGVAENIANLERALKKAGNKDYTLKVFPQAGHALLVGEAADRKNQSTAVMYFAPGYYETMDNWILRRVSVPK